MDDGRHEQRGRSDNLKRRLASGAVWAVTIRLAALVVGLAMNAALARLLAPADMGLYFLIFSVVMVAAVPAQLGYDRVAVRGIAEALGLNRPQAVWRTARTVLIRGGLGALIMAGLLLAGLGDALLGRLTQHQFLAGAGALLALWVAVHTMQCLLQELFRGFSDIRASATFGMLLPALLSTLVLWPLLLVTGEASLIQVTLIVISASIVTCLIAAAALYLRLRRIGRAVAKDTSPAAPIAWALILNGLLYVLLQRADIWVLGVYRPEEEVAIYGAAARLFLLIRVPVQLIGAAVPPLIAELYAQRDMQRLEWVLRYSAGLYAIPSAMVLLTFAAFGHGILELIFGSYYTAGYPVLLVLSLGQLVSVWFGNALNLMIMTQRDRAVVIITIVSLALAIVVASVGARHFGAVGVATGFALAYALRGVATAVYCRRAMALNTLPYLKVNPRAVWRELRELRSAGRRDSRKFYDDSSE